MSELYYDRIVIIPIFLLPFVLLLNGIITSWYYYRMFVIRNSTITKYIQYRMNYYWITPLPISTITKVFHPRIVPIPNATITELRITELFYYGLLLPNVAHSLRTSQIETLNSQGHRGRVVLTNSSPLAQKAKESLKSSSVKVKLNKSILLIFGLSTYGLGCPNLPGCKFNSFMKIFHFSMWLVCISIDTSIKIFVKRSFEFFLCVTQTFDLSTDRSVKPWTIRCSYVRVSRGQSVTWPVLKTVQNEIGWKVHLIH